MARHRPPLTVAQLLALRAIGTEDLTGSELARRAGVSGPAVSQLVGVLADGGLVRRTPLEGDRRSWTLRLSPAGAGVLRSALALLRAELGNVLGELPRPEADALARALPQVEALLSGAPPPRRPPPPRHGPVPAAGLKRRR